MVNVKQDLPHGYSAPLKNVKRKRFRKTLVNLEVAEATEMITKELYYLLSTDLQAVLIFLFSISRDVKIV